MFKKLMLTAAVATLLAGCQPGQKIDMSDVTIYTAKTIITANPDMPVSEAVAVKDGGIVAVGSFKALKSQLKGAVVDQRFDDHILLPGLIDPHVHMTLGAMMYGLDFIPPWEMETAEGTVQGLPDKASLMAKIAEFETAAPEGPLFLYGYHNLVQGDLDRHDLDKISKTRPIFIWHYSGHDFYLNSAAIELAKLSPALAKKYHGIGLDSKGELTGRIFEDAAPVIFPTIAPYIIVNAAHIKKGWDGFESILARHGVTTIAEMGYGIFDRAMEDNYLATHYGDEDGYRLYLVPEHRAFTKEFGDGAVANIMKMSKERNRRAEVLPQVKLFTDAAFYSQTMKMATPGYIAGQSKGTDGLWVTPPEKTAETMRPYWDAGIDIHIHSNGDAAQDATLDGFAAMKPSKARGIIEHAGLLTPSQISRAGELGIGISAASHYVNYMGDDYKEAIGSKTDYITPLASAMRAGLHATVHSDAPLAPAQPLKAASVHMTRMTRQGNVSNPNERLSAEQALRAITMDAAWSLGLEDKIGSIEVGKLADFTVLGANPMITPAEDWPDIPVWGTVIGGTLHKANNALK